jgi:hypothetical protein
MSFFSDHIDTLFPFVACAFIAGVAWFIQSLRIDRIQAEHAAYVAQVEVNAVETELAKLAKETYWKEEVANAELEAEKRLAKVQADLRAAHAAAGKLRGTVSALQSSLADAPPERPSLSQPLPAESYLERARDDIQTWRIRLNAMPPTSEP